jgi:hypothetical protein
MKFIATILFGVTLCVPLWAQKPAGEPPRRLATLAQQKMCDERAEKEFHKYNPKVDPDLCGYTSHYDAEANVCFMMVHLVNTAEGVALFQIRSPMLLRGGAMQVTYGSIPRKRSIGKSLRQSARSNHVDGTK